jgi:hypothetical protein
LEARDEDVGGEEALHGLATVDGELAAVEVLVDLGRPCGHLCVLAVLFLFGAGRLVEVLDLARPPLPGKHIVEEAAEGEEDSGRREEQVVVVVGGEEARQIQRVRRGSIGKKRNGRNWRQM